MSLNEKGRLVALALERCRQLRRNQTPAEKVLWKHLRRKSVGGLKFYRQHPFFHDLTGRESFFIVDFYCHSSRVAIELDGEIHDRSKTEDMECTRILESLDVRVVRFRNEEVLDDLSGVVNKIQNACNKG